MKHKKSGKKHHRKDHNKEELTDQEKAALLAKNEEKHQQDAARKEKEKYDKYVNELREQNYRAALLSEPLKLITAMIRAHKTHKRNKLERKKWNEYLSCSSLPNVSDPPAVREFIFRWKKEIQEDLKNYFSWALDVDERSILTQDISKKNQCFWKLYNEQPVVGDQYVPRIEHCHLLLNELELVLRESQDPNLLTIKKELRTQLHDTIDQFSLRILTNVERDMVLINACSANHNFKTKSFSSSLWSTRPVPQLSKNWVTAGVTEMAFSEVDAVILLPNQIDTDGFSYRGLLMNYDHFSDMARSFTLNVPIPPVLDLRAANEQEWNKREEIMHEKLNEMKAEREKWEIKEKEKALKEEEAKKQRPRGQKIPPPKSNKHHHKAKPCPMEVTETTVIDVTEDFLKYEEDCIAQQKIAMSPESLNLIENEINLREYQIVGGVYAFHYLMRPQQYTQIKQQFLYKVGNRQILEHAEFLANEERDMIEIQLNLSGNVNWWFAPIACYWQAWEESEEFQALSPELQDFHKNYDTYIEKLENLLFSEAPPKLNYNMAKCFNDFHVDMLPSDIHLFSLIHNYLQPRVPITFKFQVELDAIKAKLRIEELRKKEAAMEIKEKNQKRREAFDKEMEEYLIKVKADTEDVVAKMKEEFEEFYVAEEHRLINHGENDLQIQRYLKHKREVDEQTMSDVKSDAMSKYQDYVDEQFKKHVLELEQEEITKVVPVHCHVQQTSPRDLFPFKPRQLPLKLISDDSVYNFDVPNEEDPPGYDGEIDDSTLISTFLRYLILLFEKNKPFFKETVKVEETETVPVDVEAPTLPPETKTKITPGRKHKPHKKGLKKPETPMKSAKKLATPIKRLKTPKTPKKGVKPNQTKQVSKSTTPNKSPRSIKSQSGSRSRSAKRNKKPGSSRKSPRSGSSKKSSRTRSSKKSPKSSRKNSKKRHKRKKTHEDEIEPTPSLPKVTAEPPHTVIRKRRVSRILNLIPHFPGKWVRSGINLVNFNDESRELKFQISRFGTFGFAMPKYCNLPLKYWELYPNAAKKHSVILKVIGIYAEIKIEIDENGYLVERIVPNNINFVPNKAAMEYRALKNYLLDCGFNIFPEYDAGIYVEGITEKHRSMEQHTYYCAAQFTLSHYFRISEINRLANNRTSVFEVYEMLENVPIPEKFAQIMVTPQNCNFVRTVKGVSKSGEQYIDFKMEPKEQEFYPDIYNLLLANCNELSKKFHGQMKRVHQYNVARLLYAIRPLSFG